MGWDAVLRPKIRAWWQAEFAGKAAIAVPEAARRAEEHFRQDQDFIDGFFEAFLYTVLYDYGISMLSEMRVVADGDGGGLVDRAVWMEYDPALMRHHALLAMTPEQALRAAEYREHNIAADVQRISVLRRLAAGASMSDLIPVMEAVPVATVSPVPESGDGQDGGGGAILETATRRSTCVRCGMEMTWTDVKRVHEEAIRLNARMAPGLPTFRESYWEVESDEARMCRDHGLCPSCAPLYPESLIKASFDCFDYALGLRNGAVIRFDSCSFHGSWVHIHPLSQSVGEVLGGNRVGTEFFPYPFDRGVDVRLDDIVWCADAPHGS